MKILNQPVSSMYLWTIALISILVVISSFTLRTFPVALVAAVLLSGIFEILIRKFYLKHPFKIPWSGIITGLVVGAVAPINASLALVLIAAIIAVLSKFFIQYRSSNIFNPATLGLIVALPLFDLGDEWWVASNYNMFGIAITLTPILIILAYEAKRLPTALSFVGISLISALALGGLQAISSVSALAIIFGVNYFFAFVMLIEPKTSPNDKYVQMVYGGAIALLYLVFTYLHEAYPLLIVLLVGNISYLVYRKYGKH